VPQQQPTCVDTMATVRKRAIHILLRFIGELWGTSEMREKALLFLKLARNSGPASTTSTSPCFRWTSAMLPDRGWPAVGMAGHKQEQMLSEHPQGLSSAVELTYVRDVTP